MPRGGTEAATPGGAEGPPPAVGAVLAGEAEGPAGAGTGAAPTGVELALPAGRGGKPPEGVLDPARVRLASFA